MPVTCFDTPVHGKLPAQCAPVDVVHWCAQCALVVVVHWQAQCALVAVVHWCAECALVVVVHWCAECALVVVVSLLCAPTLSGTWTLFDTRVAVLLTVASVSVCNV